MRLGSSGGYIWSDRQGNSIHYTPFSKVAYYEDRNGNRVTLDRNANGDISQIRDTNGQVVITYTYESIVIDGPDEDEDGFPDPITIYRVSQVQDYSGRTVTYTYNAENQLENVTDVLGKVWTYEYSGEDLRRIIDPNGRATTLSIDGSTGRLRSYANADGAGFTFDFSEQNDEVYQRRRDAEGREVENYFNKMGFMTREIRDGETLFTSQHLITSNSSGVGGFGMRVKGSGGGGGGGGSASASIVVLDRSPNWQVLIQQSVTDQRGRVMHYFYDQFGNVTRTVRADGQESHTEFHPGF